MRLLITVCLMLLVCVAVCAQDLQQQCGNHPALLRDSSGKVKWLSSDESQSRVVKPVEPSPVALPGGIAYSGFVTLRIMVNTSGDVVCIWDAKGHPVMIPSVVRAVHDWNFKPMLMNGKPVEFVGQLKVAVHSAAAD